MKIHVAIVSDQILPNLIPALMERPGKVYLVCSEEMHRRGLDSRAKKLLEGIPVQIMADAPSVGLGAIRKYATQLLAEIRQSHPEAEIVFNATGGTKLMSLGFVEVFRESAGEIIYTDTHHRLIEVFPDAKGCAPPARPMQDVLDIPTYLAAQGFRYLGARSDDRAWVAEAARREAICRYLGKAVSALQPFIGCLNGLANRALNDGEELCQPVQAFETVPGRNWSEALNRIAAASLLEWRRGERQIRFTDTESALFLRGGWLEEYAWQVVRDEKVRDVRCSVRVQGDDASRATNEFDVLACHGNELLVIECKTLRIKEENESNIAYKVESLGKQVRGLFGETWLLSARQPSDPLLKRAQRAQIRLFGPKQLPSLAITVRRWKVHKRD
ncbi:MAG TPA: DUF1887 family CARF protein [Terriglobia bacterium]|nr:DUF1887 family CARF protein [Terriglobia bacterium]